MKYIYKIFFLIILLSESAQLQPITWQKLYPEPLIGFSDGYSAVQLDDEGYIVIGSGILAMRLDRFGNLIWSKYYEGIYPGTIIKTNDGNFLIGSNTMTKINIDGDVIWSRPGASSYNLNLAKDGGFYFCSGSANLPLLRKYDSLGNISWQTTYNFVYQGGFINCMINNENDIVLVGCFSPGNYPYDYPFIMKTDSFGNMIWHKEYESDSLKYFYMTNIVQNIQNNYMVCTSSSKYYLVKFDSSGNLLNTNYFGSSTVNSGIFEYMIKTNDNGLALTGFRKITSDLYYARLLKTDYDGNVQWERLYGIGEVATGNCVNQTSDNGFIIVGRKDTFQYAQEYVIKTDEYGNTSPYVNIQSTSGFVPESFSLSQNYPNPFNPSTVIRYSLTGNRFTTLRVFDALGKEVAILVNEKQNAGTYEVDFDGSGLPSGIYFYKLSADGFSETKRMILLK